jgi:hypothetical protein
MSCCQDSRSEDTSDRQGWIYGGRSVRLRAMMRKQSASNVVLVINAGLRKVMCCGHSLLQSALAAKGRQDARNPDPGLQSVKDAQFDFDYSGLDPLEQHTTRSVMRLVT